MSNDTSDNAAIQFPLNHNLIGIIDQEDKDLLDHYWFPTRGLHTHYIIRKPGHGKSRRAIIMHRLILARIIERPLEKHELCDHINGNGLDNRRCNLRVVSRKENMWNSASKKNSTSKYKGVSWQASNHKWRAAIRENGKANYLGLFDNENQAARVYNEAAKRVYGEFARLNIIEEDDTPR